MNEIVKQDETQLVAMPTPMEMIMTAVKSGSTPEQIAQLMDLQDRFEQKEAKKSFVLALAKFRKECPDIRKDGKGHNNAKYSTLHNALDTIKSTMEDCGISHSWRTSTTGVAEKKEITVTCVITHIDGHCEESSLSAGIDTSGNKQIIQGVGSTVSYLERYTLFSVLGMTSREMDDDGYGPNQKIDEDQKEEIINLIKETKTDTAKFMKFMNVGSVDEIPLLKFNKAKNALKQKVKK